jgi:hypothetical protein
LEPSWHHAQPIRPLKDIVVETKVSDSHLVNARLDLHRPGHVFHLIGNLNQTNFVKLSFPMLLEGNLEFTVRAHATESEDGGGKLDHD